MPDFFLAVMLIFTPDGRLGYDAHPVQTYSECQMLVQAAEAQARLEYPGAEVRTSCIPSDKIGQNGL